MKKLTLFLLIAVGMLQCVQQTKVEKTVDVFGGTKPMTHKEAADTLRADTTLPLQPVVFRPMAAPDARKVLDKYDLASLFIKEYPDHGFYGNDRYHIEFFFNAMSKKSADEPGIYEVRGKNRFKKTISSFAGTMTITEVSAFTDPNLDSTDLSGMGVREAWAIKGNFEFAEDSTLATSGRFTGTFNLEFFEDQEGKISLWFFSQALPSGPCGYRFDGNWTSNQKSGSKPVIWSQDIFAFADQVLKDFSYGERAVEINPEYNNLGWDNFWDGEEWWNSEIR